MRRRIVSLAVSSALHLIAMAVIARVTATPRVAPRPVAPGSMAVFVVPREDDSAPPGLQPFDPDDADDLRPPHGSSTVEVPGFAFDAAKIESRAALLFPFLTPGISLERFELAPHLEAGNTFHDPFAPRSNARPRRARRPPLVMTDAAMQSLVDESWSRRDRWTPFQRILKLADRHDTDGGKLPALLHEYQSQDGLQPYVDASIRDPRMWTELGLAADHVEFIGFISRYAAEHPSTKATTELLFLLDKIAQASLDALATLLDTVPEEHLDWTRSSNPDAYAFVADLRRHYTAALLKKGLATGERLTAYYDKVRLGILTGILRTTPRGYRVNDARFLIGQIYWRQGSTGDALRAWRGMTIDATDAYTVSIGRILNAIATETASDRGNLDTAETVRRLALQINAVLRAEHGRWIMFSLDRLHQFGFRFDSF
jgi:hypothetical protein